MTRCTAKFEKHARPNETHTCDLEAPHVADSPHHCPTCGAWWKAYLAVVDPPEEER